MAILLFITSLIKIPLFYRDAYYIRGNGTTLESIETSASWLIDHLGRKNYTMLADINLYGKYLTISVASGYTPILQVFDDNKYVKVVSSSGGTNDFSYPDIVAIDKNSTQPTIGFFWNIYAPLNNYVYQIKNNANLDVIYEDADIILARLINLEQAK